VLSTSSDLNKFSAIISNLSTKAALASSVKITSLRLLPL
jgi:hypothetical protein